MADKTWFITGTSTGFGRLLTETLLARGDRVAATLRRPERLAPLVQKYGDRLSVSELDVTDAVAVTRTVDAAFTRFGRIDVVVNNAGYALFGAAEEVSDALLSHQLETNVMGPIRVVRAALPHLRRQASGRILQVSSVGGQVAWPGSSSYHASKWALEGFSESLAAEVAAFGIKVTIVEPGASATEFMSALQSAPPHAAYATNVVGMIRQQILAGGVPLPGDPVKMVQAMIAVADAPEPPLRLTLGGDAFAAMRGALVSRLDRLDAQRDVALSTDLTASRER